MEEKEFWNIWKSTPYIFNQKLPEKSVSYFCPNMAVNDFGQVLESEIPCEVYSYNTFMILTEFLS